MKYVWVFMVIVFAISTASACGAHRWDGVILSVALMIFFFCVYVWEDHKDRTR